MPRCDCFVLEAANRVVAYACIGKGLDFENVIHECGGSPEDLARLLPSICRVQQKELYVMIPPSRPELLQALAPWSSGASFGHLGLAISKRQLPPEFYLEGLDSV